MRTRFFFALALVTVAANAQVPQVRQYAAKFVCGKATDEQVATFGVAPGGYFTTINVHNPALSLAANFQKKFALAGPDERPGKVSEWFRETLKADEAMQIDCGSIYKHLGIAPGTFIDGFAVIQTPNLRNQFDVVGVTTTSAGGIHMERVPARLTQ